jgi:hypothetical protein
MDQIKRQIYSKLYDSYPILPCDMDWVRGTINDVTGIFAEEKGVYLREDAKYFLLINFAQMVAVPLRESVDRNRLTHDLKHDTNLLLESAASARKDRNEISGHDLVDALSKNWAELEVMKFDFWG